jgi:RNA polymerase sigma-70 factor (ECF subfamily)
MSTFRSKGDGGDVQALRVSLPADVTGKEGQTILKLEERVIALFDELRLPIYRYLLCMNIPSQEAEEIVQETFLKLYKHLHAGGRYDNPRGWVFRVAHNSGLNSIKSRKVHFAAGEDEWSALAETMTDPAAGPEELLLKKEKMRRLHVTMATLSPQQRQCLHLRMEGFRYREIAGILGVAVPTVGESLRRAMEKITREPNE